MKRLRLWLLALVGLIDVTWARDLVPLKASNMVQAEPAGDFLIDPRVFNADFYRRFNSTLNLRDDASALTHWRKRGAKLCLRGSFHFAAADYLERYPDLKRDCDDAIQHFVTAGFNEGRIGAADSAGIVFDADYYVAANDDLNSLYQAGNPVALQLHWLHHGVAEGRGASANFNVNEYQKRYPALASLSKLAAIRHYVLEGQAEQRMGRADWAEPEQWRELVARTQIQKLHPGTADVVRSFVAANGKPVTVIVQSPSWMVDETKTPQTVRTCRVEPGVDDRVALQAAFKHASRMPGDPARCDIIELAPNKAYHVTATQSDEDSHQPHLWVHGARDFVLKGNNATLYFNRLTTGLTLHSTERGIVKNLKLDWEGPTSSIPGPLFAAIGKVVVEDNSVHVVLDESTPIPEHFEPLLYGMNIWDRQRGQFAADDYLNTGPRDKACDATCRKNDGKGAQQSIVLRGRSIHPNLASKNSREANVARWVNDQLLKWPGRTVLLRFATGHPAAAIHVDNGSHDIRVIDSTIHSSPYIGLIAGQGQRGIALENLSITPSQGRPISTIADGLHFIGFAGDILIERGTYELEGDDAINLTHSWDTVTALAPRDAPGCVGDGSCFDMDGADATPIKGDTFAFFDQGLGYLGSAEVVSSSGIAPYGGPIKQILMNRQLPWLKPGVYAMNLNHAPSRFFISEVKIRRNLGRGIMVGGLHGLIQKSVISDTTTAGIALDFSTLWKSSVGASNIAIRDNKLIGTNYVNKNYADVLGLSAFPHGNAAITVFSEQILTHTRKAAGGLPPIAVRENSIATYPRFQDIEIKGNTLHSLSGAGIYMAGVRNVRIVDNSFLGCKPVWAEPNIARLRPFFGSASTSAVVISYAKAVTLTGNTTGSDLKCNIRTDRNSSKDVLVR